MYSKLQHWIYEPTGKKYSHLLFVFIQIKSYFYASTN